LEKDQGDAIRNIEDNQEQQSTGETPEKSTHQANPPPSSFIDLTMEDLDILKQRKIKGK
jgi:hypothetical protein